MLTKKLALAAVAATALLGASSAFAHDGHWRHGHRWHGYGYGYAPRVVVMPAPRVYYTPPPVVYAPPAPVVYAPPAAVYTPPVYVAPRAGVVVHRPGFTLGVGF